MYNSKITAAMALIAFVVLFGINILMIWSNVGADGKPFEAMVGHPAPSDSEMVSVAPARILEPSSGALLNSASASGATSRERRD
ncbi:exported hypothetical protein [Bradyrhizobium sp. ORS 375]|uniref:hypothetical protein n=1 Tax=Bradyrhizobium sp. (strain ORS 375) TaxID=566679 RepID=UPI0002405F88|nr:hypothetical protein [Bradyrhizobium sp. ORS 375]CCD97084.1 exported hypothetical protein [Bradyrhizobium sp. ORS 375]